MKLETVGSISVGGLTLESLWKIDDVDCLEGTLLNAHTTTNAHHFRNKTDLAGFGDFNTHFALLVKWTSLLALESASLWLAFIWVNNCNSNLSVVHDFDFYRSSINVFLIDLPFYVFLLYLFYS